MPRHEFPFPIPDHRLHKLISEHPQWCPTGDMIDVTTATFTPNVKDHNGYTMRLKRAAGITVTLPPAIGKGDTYAFFIGTTVSSNSTIIKVANASDTMVGQLDTATTTGATTNGFCEAAGGTDDTITMNGTTTGGIVGSYVVCKDVDVNLWLVNGILVGSGTLATSLSATV